ncbi:MAG: putative phage tail protein [Planctomycetota bacterium]
MQTEVDYRAQALSLLPPGGAFSKDPDSTLARVYQALARELVRIEQRMQDALNEADPRTAVELLPEWEKAYGLPGGCSLQTLTPALRRQSLVAKVTSSGGQSRQYLIQVADAVGWPITIEEFVPFRVGSPVGEPLADGMVFAFEVHAPQYVPQFFQAGSSAAGDSLQVSGNELLECTIDDLKPAHTVALYVYDAEPEVAWAPWTELGLGPAAFEFVAIPMKVKVS